MAVLALVLALAVPLGTVSAEARAGGGFSFGSRGARTYSTPAPTNVAPRSAQPFQRTAPYDYGTNRGFQAPRRGFGFGTGFAAGLLGAGLFGLLTGGGFFGGLDGLDAVFGLLLQVALIGAVIWFVMRLFGRRPAFAGRPGGFMPGGSGFAPTGRSAPVAQTPITITPADYSAFQGLLGNVQAAHSREDLGGLSRLATPDMVRGFAEDIERNRSRGLHNEVRDVTLLQGDLSEAWREGVTDFATVAMRFAARDVMLDRASGRLAEGDPNRPVEATELWTFRRDRGGPWLLSAIQQAA